MQDQTQKPNNPVAPAKPAGVVAGAPKSAPGAVPNARPATAPGATAPAAGAAKPAAPAAPNNNPSGTRSVAQQNDFMRKVSDKIKNAENILVALSRDPSVDELAAALGLTMFLDSLQKHTTAIFSGLIPNALQFLQPDETFENNTDSLQDFIITLDKDKADHLRYKLDGDFVKIYITPYKTLITQDDLEFSRGDYNVDLVLALGVPTANDLDEALAEHGRIMHDATAVDITTDVPGRFAEIEWSDPGASSVSEMVTRLILTMRGQNVRLDKEIATALLTGIVAATGRFSNDRTTSETLEMASKLMSMGADQQLISANVMDNSPMAQGYIEQPVTPKVDREQLAVARDYNNYNNSALSGGQGNVVVQPTMTVSPEVAAELQANAARAAAAKAAVNDAVSSAVAEAAATGATGVAMNSAPTRPVLTEAPTGVVANAAPVANTEAAPAKDYAKMMADALAEANGAPANVSNTMASAPVVPMATATAPIPGQANTVEANSAGTMNIPTPAAGVAAPIPGQTNVVNPAASAVPAEATGEPVANPGVVLPPPPTPAMGNDMMPPVLPPVQM